MMFIICIGVLGCQTLEKNKYLYYPGIIETKNDLILEYSRAFRVLKFNNLIGVSNERKTN